MWIIDRSGIYKAVPCVVYQVGFNVTHFAYYWSISSNTLQAHGRRNTELDHRQ